MCPDNFPLLLKSRHIYIFTSIFAHFIFCAAFINVSSQWASLGLITNKQSRMHHNVLLLSSHFWKLAEVLRRGEWSCLSPSRSPSVHCWCFYFLIIWLFSCFLFCFFTAVVTVASVFSTASGCLLSYFLINSHFVFLTPSAVEITSWSQAPSDRPQW